MVGTVLGDRGVAEAILCDSDRCVLWLGPGGLDVLACVSVVVWWCVWGWWRGGGGASSPNTGSRNVGATVEETLELDWLRDGTGASRGLTEAAVTPDTRRTDTTTRVSRKIYVRFRKQTKEHRQ